MTKIEILDVAAHVCELALVVGIFAVARGHSAGWALRLAGSVGWIGIAIALADQGILLTSLIVWPLLYAAVDVYGLKKWTED